MSNRAPAWFETKYVDGVTHKIQAMGNLLQGSTRPPDREQGKTVVWKVSGSGEASLRSAAAEQVTVMNLDRSTVQNDMQDWEANDYVDLYDLTKMSENEQAETQKSGAMAIGRRKDKIVLRELDRQAAAGGGTTTTGDGSAAITILDPVTARDEIIDIGVGSYRIWCTLTPKQLTQLSLYREFGNSQWAGPDLPLLKQIGARTWGGINFVPCPSSYFTVPAASQIDTFLWVVDAVGQATAMEWRSRIDYIPTMKKWLCANDISACAQSILPEGIKRLRMKSDAALVRPSP